MSNSDAQEGWYRRKVGRRIERGANRLIGTVLGAIGIGSAVLTLSSSEFAWSSHWPGLAVAIALLVLARMCFRTKNSVIEEFGYDYVTQRKRPK